MESNEPRGKRVLAFGLLVSVLAAAPNILWIALDRSAWGGDQSQYGRAAVELFSALRHSPATWFSRLFDVFPSKPNGLVWIGQLFVPFGRLVGSIDRALLLSIAAMQILTLWLTYGTIAALSGGRRRTALIACLVIASAPLFVSQGHQYLVETLQTLSVAWFLLIASLAPRWPRALILAQLIAATALALAAKELQPLFCVGPGLLALSYAFRPRPQTSDSARDRLNALLTLALGIPLAIGTLAWYVRNLEPVKQHVRASAFGPAVRIFWGKEDTYLNTVVYWLGSAGMSLFHPAVCVFALLLILGALVRSVARGDRRTTHFTPCAIVTALQVVLVVLVFASSPTRMPRYLLPMLPYVALLVAWSVAQIDHVFVSVLGIAVFTLQLVEVQAQTFARLASPDRNAQDRGLVDAIVARTCPGGSRELVRIVLAIDPGIKGDWLAPEPANYAVAKESLYDREGPRCRYGYAGDNFFGASADEAWSSLLTLRVRYFVTVDPAVYPVPVQPINKALDRENFPVLLERVRTSSLFEQAVPLPEDPGILIFRATASPAS